NVVVGHLLAEQEKDRSQLSRPHLTRRPHNALVDVLTHPRGQRGRTFAADELRQEIDDGAARAPRLMHHVLDHGPLAELLERKDADRTRTGGGWTRYFRARRKDRVV